MSISSYINNSLITERLHITSKTKSLRITPKSKEELQSTIKSELERQGPDADLNFIDTSEITDMSWLFNKLNTRNIKIDEWDTSKVTNMSYMFAGCMQFNGDLSSWNVSNVKYMSSAFQGCYKFKSDLSGWDTSNVKNMYAMFSECKEFEGKGIEIGTFRM